MLPAEWTLEKYSDTEELTQSDTIKDLDVRFNEPIDEELFTPEFAPRTLIRDEATLEFSIVRNDKSIRKITAEELKLDIPYDDLAEMP